MAWDPRLAILKKAEDRRNARQEQYQEILSDPLDMAILHYVYRNEKYVTPNAIQQALRGLTVQLGSPLQKTEDCGRFQFVPGADVLQEIETLRQRGFLNFREVRGTYGRFNIVKLAEISIDFFVLEQDKSEAAVVPDEWWNSSATFRDYLAGIQEKLKNHEDARKEQLELMHHLENSHIVAYFHDDIVRSFPREDKDLCNILKMYRSMQEKNSFTKKILGHIIQGKLLFAQ